MTGNMPERLAGHGLPLAIVSAAAVVTLTIRFFRRRSRRHALEKEISLWISEVHNEEQSLENRLADLEVINGELWTQINLMSYKDLNSSLKSGEVRAVDAVRAYQWAALKANSRLNCVCQFIREAEEWAEACDAMPQEDRAGRPLHGIPISVKDNYEVKGYAITAGSPRMINNICEKDALVVEIIRCFGDRIRTIPFIIISGNGRNTVLCNQRTTILPDFAVQQSSIWNYRQSLRS